MGEQAGADRAAWEGEMFRLLAANVLDYAIFAVDPHRHVLSWSKGAERLLGFSEEEIVGRQCDCFFTPEDVRQGVPQKELDEALRTGRGDDDRWHQRKDGTRFWASGVATPLKDEGGTLRGFCKIMRDCTGLKRSQDQLADSQRRHQALFDHTLDAVLLADDGGRYVDANPAACSLLGLSRDDLLRRTVLDITPPPNADAGRAAWDAFLRDGTQAGEYAVRRPDGTRAVVEYRAVANVQPGLHLSVLRDVTDREAAEGATARLAAIVESSDDAIIGTALDGAVTSWNAGAERLYGYATAELVGRRYSVLIPPGKEAEAEAALSRVRRGEAVPAFETVRLHKSGRGIDVTVSVSPIRDRSGRVVGASKIARDITRTKVLEEQFRQAQKMDAVGRLAGGVAHDFNNLLTVINGYGEIVHEALPPGHPSRELVAEIKKAGDRAAGLTRQLLAFSRQAVLEPKVLDVNALVRDLEKLLRRLLGEDVDLATRLAPDVGRVKVDPGQLEQAVVNLCVNARDAMPTGGNLTVETGDADLDDAYAADHPDVRPGPHVLIAVADTGTGMTPEVQARIFEPFFTTKEAGKGTGLGLAMVFGFVQQSGGHVAVYSEPGRGSTFKLYLPRVEAAPATGKSGVRQGVTPRGTETVLLVEDEDAVRALGRHILVMCGYTVVEAGNGREAVKVADGHAGPVHIVVTDVVMPGGMGGRQVAEAVAARHPEAKVLFTSGYTDDAVVRHGVLKAGVHFLQKPFTPTTLAQKVRDVLDGTSSGGGT